MKNTKRLVSAFLTAALMLSGLTACGPSQNPPASDEKENPTVSVALWGNQLLEGFAPYLQDCFPEVEFEFYVANNSADYYRFRQEKGALPDIMTLRRFSLTDVKNLKEDLIDLSDTDLANTFYQSYLRNYTYEDGTVNWLPACAEVDSVILNKTLFETHQIPIPTDYESFVSACRAFEKKGIRGFLTDYKDDYACMEVLQGLSAEHLSSAQGRQWRLEYESGQTRKLNPEVWMPVFEKMEDFISVTGLAPEEAVLENRTVIDGFQNGTLAMYRGTGADIIDFNQAGQPLLMPYFGDTKEDSWYLTYPAFQVAAKATDDPEREQLILEIMGTMLSEAGMEKIATGQNMVAYNKDVQLTLLPELDNLKEYIDNNRLFIRLASADMFSISQTVVQKMIRGELPDAKAAYDEFERLLGEEKEELPYTVHLDKSYPYAFHPDHGSQAASAITNSIREQFGTDFLLGQSVFVAGEIVEGHYREHEVKYLMQGENARLFTVTLTGNELEKLISHSLNLHGTRGSVANESSLYVSSGFEMQVRKTDDGYLLEELTIEGKPMDMEKTYSIGIISGEYYFAPTLFSDCGITDYALSELYPKQLLADRLIKEGKQLAAPTDYITLVK